MYVDAKKSFQNQPKERKNNEGKKNSVVLNIELLISVGQHICFYKQFSSQYILR